MSTRPISDDRHSCLLSYFNLFKRDWRLYCWCQDGEVLKIDGRGDDVYVSVGSYYGDDSTGIEVGFYTSFILGDGIVAPNGDTIPVKLIEEVQDLLEGFGLKR